MTEQEAGYCMSLIQRFWDFWNHDRDNLPYNGNLWVWPRTSPSSVSFNRPQITEQAMQYLQFKGVVCNDRLFVLVSKNYQVLASFHYNDDGWACMYDVLGNTMYRGTLR